MIAYKMAMFLMKIRKWEESNILHPITIVIHVSQLRDPMISTIDVSSEFMMAAFIQNLLPPPKKTLFYLAAYTGT
jgi:hypothetical protein